MHRNDFGSYLRNPQTKTLLTTLLHIIQIIMLTIVALNIMISKLLIIIKKV